MLTAIALGLVFAQQKPGSTEVTIYNKGFALVKEDRVLNLKKGRQTVAIENVAAQVEPNSVGFHSLGDKNAFQLLEQNYQFDLISPQAILNKAVGSRIRFIRVLPNATKEVLTGFLMSSPTALIQSQNGDSTQTYNGMVIKTDDNRIILNPTGEVEVESIPEGMISTPTLFWEIEAPKATDSSIELSYLTQGMSWNADYVMTLNGSGTADLQGWVTLTNQCGTTFKNAKLKLLAGEVNRVALSPLGGVPIDQQLTAGAAGHRFAEESLFEYHLYTLDRPTDLKNKQIKQVSLLEGHGVNFQKKLVVDTDMLPGSTAPSEQEAQTGKLSPQVRIEFMNSEKNNLGMPLPQGSVKVYQRDASGSVQMVGEDSINHTPKNEMISLLLGRSFDVVYERKRTNYHRLTKRSATESFQFELRNHKADAARVYVRERHVGTWSISKSTQPYTKPDSDSTQYIVDLKPNETRTITYSVNTTW